MKLAISTYSLWRWRNENKKTMDEALAWIAESGVPGVEFAAIGDEMVTIPKRATHLKKRCQKLGLKIVSYCVGAELLVPTEQQKRVVDELKKQIDAAAELGVPSIRHDVTRGFGDNAKGLKIAKTFDAAVKHVVPAIREVADYAKKLRIKTSLENHGFYMQESKRVEKLINAVDHPNYGLTIDLGNFMCVNENPTDATKRLAKYVIMAHAKDFHVKPKDRMPHAGWFATPTDICLRGAIAGHGALDLPAQIKLLKKAGYNGYLSLEFEGIEEPTTGIKLGLDYLKPLM